MYVCICRGITEEMLNNAIKGHKRPQDALNSLGVGSDCGICLIDAVNKLCAQQSSLAPQQNRKDNEKN